MAFTIGEYAAGKEYNPQLHSSLILRAYELRLVERHGKLATGREAVARQLHRLAGIPRTTFPSTARRRSSSAGGSIFPVKPSATGWVRSPGSSSLSTMRSGHSSSARP